MNGTALVRAPSSRLAGGIVTHIRRTPVDVARARAQHAAYTDAVAASGWTIAQVPAAEDCPDSVFIEDTVVVCEDLAVLARPGAPARRAEVAGAAGTLRSLGLRTAAIQEPGTLDGGDVLQAGRTVYVGRGGRTNGAGIRQLRALLAPLGRARDRRSADRRAAPEVRGDRAARRHLPAGTAAGAGRAVPGGPPGGRRKRVPCRSAGRRPGAHRRVRSPHRELLDDMGFTPVVADISEFEKLEGCVTCLSVLLPGR